MDTTWTLGVLHAGAENVQHLAGGTATTRAGAVAAASDTLVVAAIDRGRQEYRIRMADTLILIVPGLTETGEVDLVDLGQALDEIDLARGRR